MDGVSGAAARTGDFIKEKKEAYYKNRNERIVIKQKRAQAVGIHRNYKYHVY